MRLLIYLISLAFLLPSGLYGQDFTASGFLLSAYDDPLVQNINDQSAFLRSADMRTPNIDEVELRTRSEDLNLSPDDVRLRLGFTNFGEIREGKRYKDLLQTNYQLEYHVRVHVALIHRYELLADIFMIQRELELTGRELLNLEDQIKVEKAELLLGSSDAGDIADLENDYTKLLIDESELRSRLGRLQSQLLVYYSFDGDINLPQDSLISPSGIIELLNSSQLEKNPELALKEQDLELGIQETQLERKENMGNLGFVQAEYQRDPDRVVNENLGYRIGVTIPITNQGKAENELNKLRNLRQQQSIDLVSSEINMQTEMAEKELRALESQYSQLDLELNDLKARNRALQGKYLNVKTRLSIQENEFQFEKALLKTRFDLLTTYINWLDKSGNISSEPLRNYFYNGTPLIRE